MSNTPPLRCCSAMSWSKQTRPRVAMAALAPKGQSSKRDGRAVGVGCCATPTVFLQKLSQWTRSRLELNNVCTPAWWSLLHQKYRCTTVAVPRSRVRNVLLPVTGRGLPGTCKTRSPCRLSAVISSSRSFVRFPTTALGCRAGSFHQGKTPLEKQRVGHGATHLLVGEPRQPLFPMGS